MLGADEFHFLMHCKLYDSLRVDFFSNISDIFEIDNLPLDQLFIKLMSAQDYDIVKCVVRFASTAYTIRDKVKC